MEFKKGDKIISQGECYISGQKVGQVGTIIGHDNSNIPYLVELEDGFSIWMTEKIAHYSNNNYEIF